MTAPLHSESDMRKIGGLRGRSDQLERRPASVSGIPPYVDTGDPDVVIVNGTDPTVYTGPGRWFSSYRAAPSEDLAEGDVVLVLMSVGVDGSAGATGTGSPTGTGGYEILFVPYTGLSVGSTLIGGGGFTQPGGAGATPYPVVPLPAYSSNTDRIVLSVLGVTDPSASTFLNTARPDWPGTYADGDTIFYGHLVFRVGT